MIKNDIINKIQDGILSPGEKIPTESELQILYSVSSTTVVKALNELSLNGYLYRVQGKGSFVSKASRGDLARYFENDYLKYDKSKEKTILLNVERFDNSQESCNNSYYFGTGCYRIERLKMIDQTPILYSISYIKKYLLDDSKKTDFKNFYDAIKIKHGINLFKSKKTLNCQAIIPNNKVKKILKMQNNSFIIYIQQNTYINKSEKVEYTQTFKNPIFFNIDIETSF